MRTRGRKEKKTGGKWGTGLGTAELQQRQGGCEQDSEQEGGPGPGSGACPRCTLLRAGGLAADKASGVTSEDDSRKPQPCRPRSLVPTLGRSPSSGQATFGHHHSPELTQLCDPAKCVSGFRGGRRQTTGFGGSALLVAEEKGSCSWDGHTEPGFCPAGRQREGDGEGRRVRAPQAPVGLLLRSLRWPWLCPPPPTVSTVAEAVAALPPHLFSPNALTEPGCWGAFSLAVPHAQPPSRSRPLCPYAAAWRILVI